MKSFKQFLKEFMLSEGRHDKTSFKAVFLCGSPGSGKSFVSNHILGNGKPHGLKYINSDEGFEFMLDKAYQQTGDERYLPQNLQYVADEPDVKGIRKRAKSITVDPTNLTGSKYGLGIKERLGLLIDGTGADKERIKQEKELLESLGYETFMIYVDIDYETAHKRNRQRVNEIILWHIQCFNWHKRFW